MKRIFKAIFLFIPCLIWETLCGILECLIWIFCKLFSPFSKGLYPEKWNQISYKIIKISSPELLEDLYGIGGVCIMKCIWATPIIIIITIIGLLINHVQESKAQKKLTKT